MSNSPFHSFTVSPSKNIWIFLDIKKFLEEEGESEFHFKQGWLCMFLSSLHKVLSTLLPSPKEPLRELLAENRVFANGATWHLVQDRWAAQAAFLISHT